MAIPEAVPVFSRWKEPEGIAPRGTLIVVPGRGEHPGLYERFGRRVAADGYRVWAVADPTFGADRVTRQVVALLADDPAGETGPAPRVLVGSDTGALFARQGGRRAEPAAVGVPVLGLHGGDDAVSPLAGVRARYAGLPAAELVSIAGGRHDALNDQPHRTVAATVVLFLERLRLGADTPAIARPEILHAEALR